ncbi:MAG: hypothetical protein LBK59_11575, partial [Bifidobacteriaceae bacterium]|nr:hypothetical protein [Bifidobacteriaceae bacterium]
MDPAHSIRAIAIPLALAVCIGSLLPVTAQAASTSSTIDVDDTSMTWGNGWTWRPDDDNQSIGTFTVADGADVTLTGTTTQNRVLITGVATIRLADASIDVSGISDPAFRLDPGADLTLLLSGVNTIRGGGQNAGIYVPPDTSITIDSASAADDEIGVLHAYAGAADGAGIGGGGSSEANSPITINGG